MSGYKMKQPILQPKLSALRTKFRQAALKIDRIPLEKWTQAYDGGKRYGHMTTNLAECINSILKWAQYEYLYVICITNLRKLENQLHKSRTTWRRLVLPHLQRSRMTWQRLLLPHLQRSRTTWRRLLCNFHQRSHPHMQRSRHTWYCQHPILSG